jgi:hypothetical protein
MRWTAPLQRHRNVPIHDSDGTTTSYILAFSEGPELANSGRQRMLLITTGLHPKTDVERFHDRNRV